MQYFPSLTDSRVCPVSVILHNVLELPFETILMWGMIREKKERMWSTPLVQILYHAFWDIKSSNGDCCRLSTIPFVLYSLATSVVRRNTNPAPWSLNSLSLLCLNPPSSRIGYDRKVLQITTSWNEIACTMENRLVVGARIICLHPPKTWWLWRHSLWRLTGWCTMLQNDPVATFHCSFCSPSPRYGFRILNTYDYPWHASGPAMMIRVWNFLVLGSQVL